MPMPYQKELNPVNRLLEALDSRALNKVRQLLNGLSAAEIAHLLESSPPKERDIIWELVDSDIEGDILQKLSNEDVRGFILAKLDTSEVAAITEGWETDDIADILQQLPKKLTQEVLELMSLQDRQRVESVLPYPEDSAGGLMSTDTITVRSDINIDVVLRYLRRHEELPSMTNTLFVVGKDNLYIGALPLQRILTAHPATPVYKLLDEQIEVIQADMPDSEVAQLFERNDWVSAPVVDEQRQLLGRITIDDVVDVIREDADHSLMGLAGLGEDEDTFSTIRNAAPRRLLWLGINLLTALAASAVIGQFQETIDKVIALAVLMPIVASMGGVAGTQTLTVVIRGMALGHVTTKNMRWLLSREFLLGALNGCIWATIIGAVASLWFKDMTIGLIMAAAMVINLTVAAVAGVYLPAMLKKMRIDPALAGGVALTTVTDITGFLSFLGLATIFFA